MAKDQKIEYGSKEHEALLSGAYGGMTKAQAELIIKERVANPLTHPYESAREAQNFLDALKAKPKVVAKNKAWKRDKRVLR